MAVMQLATSKRQLLKMVVMFVLIGNCQNKGVKSQFFGECGKSRPENWTEVNKLVLCPYCETVALRRTWNRRPIEDAQAVRIAELETERDRLREALKEVLNCEVVTDTGDYSKGGTGFDCNEVKEIIRGALAE